VLAVLAWGRTAFPDRPPRLPQPRTPTPGGLTYGSRQSETPLAARQRLFDGRSSLFAPTASSTPVASYPLAHKPPSGPDWVVGTPGQVTVGRGRQMDRQNAEWYRTQAAACSALAEKATDPLIKAFNQAEAERWLRLAELAEKLKLK
jgi:hypothetical protein